MARVTGIGGIFFRARDPKALAAWYAQHLGIQITKWGGAKFLWTDEVPPTTGTGSGTDTVTLDTATKTITYNVTYSGLSGPAAAAHIHCGAAAGANSGVAVPFPKAASPISGTATMTDAQIADLEAGKCYVNVHTAANKGGEVRAQLTK